MNHEPSSESRQPPPLDYMQTQPSRQGWGLYIGGLALGTALTAAAIPLTLVIAFVAGNEGRDPAGTFAAIIPGAVLILSIVGLTISKRSRRFGLGMLTGLPIGFLTIAVICSGIR